MVSLSLSQDTTQNWKLYPSNTDTVLATDTVYRIVKSNTPGRIKVVKDNRIDKVSQDIAGGKTNKPIIKGYRIQITSSSTKSLVDGERGRFMSTNSGVKTYVDYKAPNFRLRVGNFRTKLDAQKFQNEIKDQFPNTLVISDDIELPRLED